MTIVYSTTRATLWHARAEDILQQLGTGTADLLVLDLPYGQAYDSNYREERFGQIEGDDAKDRGVAREIVSRCLRVLDQRRHIYSFGPDDVFEELSVSERVPLIWDKGKLGMGDLAAPWGSAHEPITFAVSTYRHGGEAGKSSLPARMRKGSVLRYGPPTGRKVRHPNEKPIPLLQELIESSSRIGDTVLDPTAGSGSTGVAAIVLRRKALLIETDERWIPMIVERLREAERVADDIEALGTTPRVTEESPR